MTINFSILSDSGPRSKNEDAVLTWVSEDGVTIACIADGLGGMGKGEIASQLAIDVFKKHITTNGVSSKKMVDAANKSHEEILKAHSLEDGHNKMATTFTAIAINGHNLIGVHCGDTRAIVARGNGIKRLTKDHSEAQRLFDAGKLTNNEFATYERKHILESALGNSSEPQIDTFSFDLKPMDWVLLTTDGVHNIVFLREMKSLISSVSSPSELINRTEALIKQRIAMDNFSMIAMQLQ